MCQKAFVSKTVLCVKASLHVNVFVCITSVCKSVCVCDTIFV